MLVPEHVLVHPMSSWHWSGFEFPWALQWLGLIVADIDSIEEYTEAPNSDANVLLNEEPIDSSQKLGGVF